jgi:acetyltransferase-like isoleucine patch superfamily enzyme
VNSTGSIVLGRRCGIGSFTYIATGKASVVIGDFVRIGAHTYIGASNRGFEDPNKLIIEHEKTEKGIVVEDDVWVGANCVILDGVCIGRGSVIGAGAVVTRDIPPLSIAVGNPARVIRKRGEKAVVPAEEQPGDGVPNVMSAAEELIAPG